MCFGGHARAEAVFLPYLDGVPLHEQFTLDADSVIQFDKPQGQIVEFAIWCERDCPSPEAVEQAYEKSLVGQGWKKNETGTFQNGSMTLSLSINSDIMDAKPIIVTFHMESR